MKTKILERPRGSLVARPGTVRFTLVPLDGHSATSGWFFRRPPSVGPERPKRCQTALRGRPVANSMTTDCHRLRRRPRNLSVPPARLFKTMARPPEGQPSAPGARGGIETPVGRRSRAERRRLSNGSARPAGRLSGRRCLQNGAMSKWPDGTPSPAGGPIQSNGVRNSAAAGPDGVELQRNKPRKCGRPRRPSSAASSPRRPVSQCQAFISSSIASS